ncbi:hypothetical protein COLO4_24678 [Corchorus olitorius]|uniref:Uncharacterized protein n=1 Tax=Corchorus olitorius TaxID=93759 RepID=A0A1R3I841_9ROSI|nr:hypothetical protein COLO4_24678 [Corchorus olitorius]
MERRRLTKRRRLDQGGLLIELPCSVFFFLLDQLLSSSSSSKFDTNPSFPSLQTAPRL